jgi:copper/silver efflux system protein
MNDRTIQEQTPPRPRGPLSWMIRFSLEQPLILSIAFLLLLGWGVAVAPFDWGDDLFARNPIAVDAIPDLGENQQIVFTDWPGRSPQDVEDQVTYPLTVSLMGLPGVIEVRSTSMFGFSTISVVFDDNVEFYWSRSRILEKLNSLPPGTLPDGVQPGLGPDATALGQVFWYTLEGRDPDGRPVGGWDLHELRSVQDFYVRYGLLSAEGISEIASVGGFVQEYQVDVDPDALRAYDVSVSDVFSAVRDANLDIGARTTEINRVEYVIRGVGFVKELADIESAVVATGEGFVPVRVRDVAHVSLGPAERRGALDVEGAEAVGGVAVVRDGYNPLQAINNLKTAAEVLGTGLPIRPHVDWERTTRSEVERFAFAQGLDPFRAGSLNDDAWMTWLRSNDRSQWPHWLTTSQVTIVPFYDRTGLIYETLGTLNDALIQQVLVTIIVVLLMLMHLRSAMVVSSMLPFAVLLCFVGMYLAGVDANIVALSGIAIAIGTIVDMGIIVSENVMRHLGLASPDEPRIDVVHRGASEVGGAVLTAIATTVISFLPVFAMTGAEGKLFTPLAYTKTFVLIAAVFIALTAVPVILLHTIARRDRLVWRPGRAAGIAMLALGIVALLVSLLVGWSLVAFAAVLLALAGAFRLYQDLLPPAITERSSIIGILAVTLLVAWMLAAEWMPFGHHRAFALNLVFVVVLLGSVVGLFMLFERRYASVLRWALAHRAAFLSIPVVLVALGLTVWLGFDRLAGVVPAAGDRIGLSGERIRTSRPYSALSHAFPGLGREFMPALDEGSFLWMPTLMPHASIGEALEVMQIQNMAFAGIPEVETVVGKIGRAESALDPAPLTMFETVINYRPEYRVDEAGRILRFAYDRRAGAYVRDEAGDLVPDRRGRPYRQWRDHIRSPQDIWDEIVRVGAVPGSTSAPRLQPIETRLVMLQTGMRAPMGIKVRGPNLATIDQVAVDLEAVLREVPSVEAATVNAERVVGKPYLEIEIDREAIARYGLSVVAVQEAIAIAVGGMEATTTVEGRERYNVRVRYPRELRADIESIEQVTLRADDGVTVPLREVSRIEYSRGPQMIRSENTFPVSYVTFGGVPGVAEVDVVDHARAYIEEEIRRGRLVVPAGVSYNFAGSYENQIHAARTLRVVLPISLLLILLILYLQFRSVPISLMVFAGVAVAWAGGFVMLWFYGQDWFMNVSIFGENFRDLFQLHAINLSVAVWVGFLALFGIAVDDGVVMATYLNDQFEAKPTESVAQIREATLEAGLKRVRPCLMTSATTILALLPVLTSTGRGSDIMIPMALPSVGGMTLVLITMFTVPVLFAWLHEARLARAMRSQTGS